MNGATTAYLGYVMAAYVVAVVLVGGLVLWTVLGARAARKDLLALQAESDRLLGAPAHSAPAPVLELRP